MQVAAEQPVPALDILTRAPGPAARRGRRHCDTYRPLEDRCACRPLVGQLHRCQPCYDVGITICMHMPFKLWHDKGKLSAVSDLHHAYAYVFHPCNLSGQGRTADLVSLLLRPLRFSPRPFISRTRLRPGQTSPRHVISPFTIDEYFCSSPLIRNRGHIPMVFAA